MSECLMCSALPGCVKCAHCSGLRKGRAEAFREAWKLGDDELSCQCVFSKTTKDDSYRCDQCKFLEKLHRKCEEARGE